MQRRYFCWGLCACIVAIAANARSATHAAPWFWRARRKSSIVYLLGAAEANDRAWYTPEIQGAFEESAELWLETPLDPWPAALVKERAYGGSRTFFESLEPDVRERAIAYVEDLGIEREAIEPLRPWYAYYRINGAFWKKYPRASTENPDAVLRDFARRQGKAVKHEFENGEALMEFFASMPPLVQSQYIEMLLDFLDDEKRGINNDYVGWVDGHPSTRALDRMRIKTPELYKVMQADRNVWWAKHIEGLLAKNGMRFVLLGMNHVLGPEGVPSQLAKLGVELTALHER
jgi:uncharacterized protein